MKLLNSTRRTAKAARHIGGKLWHRPTLVPSLVRAVSARHFKYAPIVIGGCGRSGTTLLLSILSAHPSIVAIPYETYAFTPTLYGKKPNKNAPFEPWRLWCGLAEAGFKSSTDRVCEKTPKNVLVFGRLISYFDQDVKLIHIVRDGRDVVTSRHPRSPNKYFIEPGRWVSHVDAGLKYVAHPCVHTLRYEDLVTNPSETIVELGHFLDEDVRSLADNWVEKADVKVFGPLQRQVGRPLDSTGIGRWRNTEHEDRIEVFLAEPGAQELLVRFGYL